MSLGIFSSFKCVTFDPSLLHNVFLALCQDGAVRLRGGQSNAEGRVEICFDNRWGTVCDDLWTSRDGNIVCKELGFSPTGTEQIHLV